MGKLMKLSIIIPSRERIHLLQKCLYSIFEQNSNQHDIEVVLAIDDDDFITHGYLEGCEYPINYFSQPRSSHPTNSYINQSLKFLSGDLYWILGNDCTILTQDYDRILFENWPIWQDQIAYFKINDGILNTHWQHNQACCFPLLTAKVVQLFKFFIPPQIIAWGGDIALWEIFKKLNQSRVVDLTSKIEVLHYSEFTGYGKQDEINKRIEIMSPASDRLSEEQINQYSSILNSEIERCQNN